MVIYSEDHNHNTRCCRPNIKRGKLKVEAEETERAMKNGQGIDELDKNWTHLLAVL